MTYIPPQEILERYASVLVDYALGGGEGIKPGDVVRVTSPESAKPLYMELLKAVWRAGGNVIGGYYPDDEQGTGGSRAFYELASDEQIAHFPARYLRGLVDEMDHQVSVLADSDPHALEKVDPSLIMRRGETLRPVMDWRGEKENDGRFSWTLGLYGTPAMAAEAGMSIEEYWEQIIHACFLDEEDPISRWREIGTLLEDTRMKLDALEIERVHVEGEDVDLWVTVGESRRWLGGRGRNIPSFELFTSPDWRGDRRVDPLQPAALPLRQPRPRRSASSSPRGASTQATAEENEAVLKEMIATPGADAVGEFSLTDKRFSRITRFMAADPLRRERRRPLRQHAHCARALLPGRLCGRPGGRRRRGVGAARLQQLERPHRHRLDDRPRRHRRSCAAAASGPLPRRRVPARGRASAAGGRR